MQSPFLAAINQLCDEKNIPKERIFETLEAALKAAYRKDYGHRNQEVEVKIDRNSGVPTVYLVLEVVEEVEDDEFEISLSEAKKHNKNIKVGENVFIDVTPSDYGRIAAQAAKQVIMQRVQDAERDILYETFKDRENELVNAVVHRVDGNTVYVNLDNKTTCSIPYDQQIPGEKYYSGQRIKLYLDKVIKTSQGPQLMISRTHANLVRKLLELEIPEIKAGSVEIKSIAREPGIRCKVAVYSGDEKIDPIGSCVGQKGVRVQNIMDELNNERIDIIKWSENMEEYIKTALAPAKTSIIKLFPEDHRARVYVQPDQRPLAIGKQGQNVRLASILTHWEIDILDISEYEGANKADDKPKIENLADLQIAPELIEKLAEANLTLVSQLQGLSAKDLAEVDGIDEEGAKQIEEAVKAL